MAAGKQAIEIALKALVQMAQANGVAPPAEVVAFAMGAPPVAPQPVAVAPQPVAVAAPPNPLEGADELMGGGAHKTRRHRHSQKKQHKHANTAKQQ
jgi:hypothetical protein